jgi:hypothetical protein
VAQNSAGRSEVTFKVWMDNGMGGGSGGGPRHRLQHQEIDRFPGAGTPGISMEVAIGVAVGTGLVVVAMTVFAAVVCVIRRRRHFHHHSYHVRDYHQTPAMSNNNSSAGKGAKKNASNNANSTNGGRASKKRGSTAKNRSQVGFSRHGGCGGGAAAGDHGLRRNTVGNSRLPACLRASHDTEVSAADDDDDDGDKDDVDGATEVRGRYSHGLRQESRDMEKFVSTTLQSLLEDKDAAVTPTSIAERQDGGVDTLNEIHHPADDLQLRDIGRINDAADAEALDVDDDCSSSALNRAGNRSPRHTATDAALSEQLDDQSECFETKKEVTTRAAEPPVAGSEANGKQNPAPDLLQDGGCGGDQLRSLFRRGGSAARSPCRRTSSRSSSSSTTGAKVSFAIDCFKDDKESNDDETSAILIPASTAGARGTSLSGFSGRYRAEENQYVKRISGLETINTYGGASSFGHGHSRPTANTIPLTPTSSSSTAAAMLLDTPESSNSGCSGYCVARTGSLGRRVRPTATTSFDGSSSADVAARHMTLPGSYCSYAATSSSGGGNGRGARSATPSAGCGSKPPLSLIAQLEKTFTMALPSTIVGVTEGLFMPPSSHCPPAQTATSSGSMTLLPPPAPRKPSRAYEWQTAAAGGCSTGGETAVSDAVGDMSPPAQFNTTAVPSSFKSTTKRVQLQPPPPTASASTSSSASSQSRKNSFGTAV